MLLVWDFVRVRNLNQLTVNNFVSAYLLFVAKRTACELPPTAQLAYVASQLTLLNVYSHRSNETRETWEIYDKLLSAVWKPLAGTTLSHRLPTSQPSPFFLTSATEYKMCTAYGCNLHVAFGFPVAGDPMQSARRQNVSIARTLRFAPGEKI